MLSHRGPLIRARGAGAGPDTAPGPTPPAPGRRISPRRVRRPAAALAAAALLAAAATACGSSGSPAPAQTTVTLHPAAALSQSQLANAAQTLRHRLNALQLPGTIDVQGNQLVAHVPADVVSQLAQIEQPGVLTLRAVILCAPQSAVAAASAAPAASGPSASGPSASGSPSACTAPLQPDHGVPPSYPASLVQGTNAVGSVAISADAYHSYQTVACPAAAADRTAGSTGVPIIACARSDATRYLLAPASVLGVDVLAANAQPGQGGWEVTVELDTAGTSAFGATTQILATTQSQIAITVDDQVVAAPTVDERINGNAAVISGSFTQQQARTLAAVLAGGALPTSFTAAVATPSGG